LLKTRDRMLVAMTIGLFSLTAGALEPLFFDTSDTGPAPAGVPAVKPRKTVPLDPDYGGQWVVVALIGAKSCLRRSGAGYTGKVGRGIAITVRICGFIL